MLPFPNVGGRKHKSSLNWICIFFKCPAERVSWNLKACATNSKTVSYLCVVSQLYVKSYISHLHLFSPWIPEQFLSRLKPFHLFILYSFTKAAFASFKCKHLIYSFIIFSASKWRNLSRNWITYYCSKLLHLAFS